MVLGLGMAENPAEKTGLELEIGKNVAEEVNPGPKPKGKKSAAEISAYFDEIFGNFSRWLSFAFSNNRPVESGNLISSESFMSGDREAFLGQQHAPVAQKPGRGGKPDRPPLDLDPPEGPGGPRIEIQSGKDKHSSGAGTVEDAFLRHSKAAIDRYYTANVVRTDQVPAKASGRSAAPRSRTAMKTARPNSTPDTTVATFAIQAVPEPSSILLCGFATVMAACFRSRPDSK